MKIKIISQKENPLFSRKEIYLSVGDVITPSVLDAKKIISKEFKSNETLVRIRKIDTSFGSNIFTIIADIYDSTEEFNRIVKKTKQEISSEKKAIIDAKKSELEAKTEIEETKTSEENTEEVKLEKNKEKIE